MNSPRPNGGKKVLFLGHEASRTGAPLFLLHLLRWLKQNRPFQLEALLVKGGELEADYAALAPTTNLEAAFRRNLPEKAYCGFLRHLTSEQRWQGKVRRRVKWRKSDLIYANTVAVASGVEACAGLGIPIIWNIHEMPFLIREFNGMGEFDRACQVPDLFIAASEAVKAGLVEHYPVAPEKIRVVHGFVSPEDHAEPDRLKHRAAVRQELGLPADAFIAGMCGRVDWRKGADWFLATAKHLQKEFPAQEIYLVWIGGPESDTRQREVAFDLRLAGLEQRVKFIGAKPKSAPYLAALDAFFLTSREDPFPLVMLEAAFHGLPVVCFDRSGGGPEFVQADAGLILEFGDTMAAARALVRLKAEPALRRQMGAVARRKVGERFLLGSQAAKIAALIEHPEAGPA